MCWRDECVHDRPRDPASRSTEMTGRQRPPRDQETRISDRAVRRDFPMDTVRAPTPPMWRPTSAQWAKHRFAPTPEMRLRQSATGASVRVFETPFLHMSRYNKSFHQGAFMKRVFLSAFFAAGLAIAATWTPAMSVEAAPAATPTFNKDVLPVLQKQCQECHRPNSIAPMSFMTYKDTRPYARAIEKAVVGRTMPPWFADPTVGHFKNTKLLSDAEIEVISAWARTARPKAIRKTCPRPSSSQKGGRSESPTSSCSSRRRFSCRRPASSTSRISSCARTSRRTCG